MEALEWAKAMCQGEGANVTLESDKEEDYSSEANDAKKVTFSIYSVCSYKIPITNYPSNALDVTYRFKSYSTKCYANRLCAIFLERSFKGIVPMRCSSSNGGDGSEYPGTWY